MEVLWLCLGMIYGRFGRVVGFALPTLHLTTFDDF